MAQLFTFSLFSHHGVLLTTCCDHYRLTTTDAVLYSIVLLGGRIDVSHIRLYMFERIDLVSAYRPGIARVGASFHA